jgi:serine protease AprX
MSTITINGNTVNLDPNHEATRTLDLENPNVSGLDYILIQLKEGIAGLNDDQRRQLKKLGVVLHEYVSERTYLCGYKPNDLTPIRSLDFVQLAIAYKEDFKVASSLKSEPLPSVLGAQPTPSLSRTLRMVDIVFHEDVYHGSQSTLSKVAEAARVDPKQLKISGNRVRLSVQEQFLNNIAKIDDVRAVLEVHPAVLMNDMARRILNANFSINNVGYSGKGQVVAVADTGFDKGSTTDCLPAFAGRVAKLYGLGRLQVTDDPNGHGTHVCGSVLGDGNSKTMGGRIQGTAPSATLVMQSLLDATGGLSGIPVSLNDLFGPPYRDDNARVHTNSWGSTGSVQTPYNTRSQDIDDFVWKYPDMVICFAAGNSGTDANQKGIVDLAQIGGEAAAKNCITVGACESNRLDITSTYGSFWPSKFSTPPIRDDPMSNRPDGMCAFSSRGPTAEGRFKPDVVAPGTSILSAHSRNALMSTAYGDSTDPDWMFDSGTSMATPLVAGCAAVLRETLIANGVPRPSAARIKALLTNGADEVTGQYLPSEAGASPNSNSGFGRVNLSNSVVVLGQTPNAGCGEGGPLTQGKEDTLVIRIPHPTTTKDSQTLKVTLVWSDPPGAALQNDLDLIVRLSDGTERHGNVGVSQDFDRLNNVEQVSWTGIPPGEVKIIIRAFRITRFAQPYAYAWRIF